MGPVPIGIIKARSIIKIKQIVWKNFLGKYV
jgi:hypothetical protein